MSGEQEPWVFRGGLTADLQVYTYDLTNSWLKILNHCMSQNFTSHIICSNIYYFYFRG